MSVQSQWNEAAPTCHRIQNIGMPKIWCARAWPWPDQAPYVGMGATRIEALDALRQILAKDCALV